MASGFYGKESVIELRDLFRETGKAPVAATLARAPAFTTTVSYANAYLYPVATETGLGGDGYAAQHTTCILWQMGEAYPPRPDDRLTVGGNTWLVVGVQTSHNADSGYGRHSCTVTDKL